MMWQIQPVTDQIFEVTHGLYIDEVYWQDYMRWLQNFFHDSCEPVYLVSNFSYTEGVDETLMPQLGKSPAISARNVGMIALVMNSRLGQFLGRITEETYARQHQGEYRIRTFTSREAALYALQQQLELDTQHAHLPH